MASSSGLSFAQNKLASSGLTVEQGEQLGMSVAKASTWSPAFHSVRALKLPYHDLDGSDSGFYRIRYLEDLPGFAGQQAKPQRYAQEKDTLNWVYLPRLPGIDWQAIANDATQEVLITEGELKACCACANGYNTIALGGVSVWQSKKKAIPLLPPLDKFNWKGRSVVVIFDSDAATNPNVSEASITLCKKLITLGAVPRIASLPPALDSSKQGLDDFLVAGGDLGAVLQDTRQLDYGKWLLKFNSNYVYIRNQDMVLSLEDGIRHKREAFINGLDKNCKVLEFRPTANGGVKREELSIPYEWMSWVARRDVLNITYRPGHDKFIEPEEGKKWGDYNSWPGWGCVPSAGNVKPWHELLEYLFNGDTENRRWFEQWLAWPLQNPGGKMYTAALIWGPDTGTGKSLIGETMGRIYGQNYTVVGNTELHASFNEWAYNKQFVMGDEITGTDNRREAEKMKAMITQSKCRINMKFMPSYEVPDCMNIYLTSNRPDSQFMDDQDRRYFVHRVPNARREPEFYENYVNWLDKKNGAAALFDYFLKLDMTGFNPKGMAPDTMAKREMIDHAKSDVAIWVQDFWRNTEIHLASLKQMLKLKEVPDLVLNKHLRLLYDPNETSKVTANGLGRELSRRGFKTLPVTLTKAFGRQRFYAVRNAEKWETASTDDVRHYVDELYSPLLATTGSKF